MSFYTTVIKRGASLPRRSGRPFRFPNLRANDFYSIAVVSGSPTRLTAIDGCWDGTVYCQVTNSGNNEGVFDLILLSPRRFNLEELEELKVEELPIEALEDETVPA